MDAKYGTPFVESEIVLAATSDDMSEVARLMSGLDIRELASLVSTFDNLRAFGAAKLASRIVQEGTT